MDFWWKSKNNYSGADDRHLSIRFYPKFILRVSFHTNKARKGVDKHLDVQLWFFGIFINYVDWEYDY